MRLLFSSIHCYLDPSSGAALCTRELLELLAARDGLPGAPARQACFSTPNGQKPSAVSQHTEFTTGMPETCELSGK